MTNDELNRKVAALRGWDVDWQDPDTGNWWGSMPNPHIEDDRMPVPDYCTDPAAWGELFADLTAENYMPLLGGRRDGSGFDASVRPHLDWYAGVDLEPGRALCLAFVASQEARNGE